MESIVHIPGEGYFRLFPFVKDSRTYDIAQTPQQAFEAAGQFGSFTRGAQRFSGSGSENNTSLIFITWSFRYAQFEEAVRSGDQSRIG